MKILRRITLNDITLIQTCGACPEQYNAFIGNEEVGYLRLRHGLFTVRYPNSKGEEIYHDYPEGDGCFLGIEREFYLNEAKKAIFNKKYGINEKTI